MISVKEAIELTLKHAKAGTIEPVPVSEAAGYVLAEDVLADIDMPPFDKSAMDGYALKAREVQKAPVVLKVAGFIPAGVQPDVSLLSGQAAKIMTGAPLPPGADSVQMVEKTAARADGQVEILESVAVGKHVARRGEIIRANSRVLEKGRLISPAVAGVLATVGKERVPVYRQPQVGILVTGDELVEIQETPGPGQIRNSNGYVLYQQVQETGAKPALLGIAADKIQELQKMIEQGLTNDVLLISGGVSMGELDLVEEVFERVGVETIYNKINIKPGKPAVFGKRNDTLVFGLPGNPVSASTIFEIIAKPAIKKMMGFEQIHNLTVKATLKNEIKSRTRRTFYPPAWTSMVKSEFQVAAIDSKGSADILAFARSNSFVIIPATVENLPAGKQVEVLLRDEFWKTCLI
ncbi:MAG: gephyrin-like molybdotransferase Glp [bacterium]